MKSCRPLTCLRRELSSESCWVRRAWRAVRSCSLRLRRDCREVVLGDGFREVGVGPTEEFRGGGWGAGGGAGSL